jgi:hypothetical protein
LLTLGEQLRLILLRLHGLHRELHHLHLHLQRLGLNVVRLSREGGAEGTDVRVLVALLLHESIIGAIDGGGHWHGPIGAMIHEDVLRKLRRLVILLRKDGRLEVGRDTGDVKGSTGGSSVRNIRAHTACAETSEEGSAVGG